MAGSAASAWMSKKSFCTATGASGLISMLSLSRTRQNRNWVSIALAVAGPPALLHGQPTLPHSHTAKMLHVWADGMLAESWSNTAELGLLLPGRGGVIPLAVVKPTGRAERSRTCTQTCLQLPMLGPAYPAAAAGSWRWVRRFACSDMPSDDKSGAIGIVGACKIAGDVSYGGWHVCPGQLMLGLWVLDTHRG
jgi:hypothetical protein